MTGVQYLLRGQLLLCDLGGQEERAVRTCEGIPKPLSCPAVGRPCQTATRGVAPMPADPPKAGGGPNRTAPSLATSTESGHSTAAVGDEVGVGVGHTGAPLPVA